MQTSKILRLPRIGRIGIVHESSGNGTAIGVMPFQTSLHAKVMRGERPLTARETMTFWARFWGNIRSNTEDIDLGSGLVTNVGVLSLANSFAWSPIGIATLKLANQHFSGTGTNVAAATDLKLQTISTNGGQTAVAGTQSLITAANSQKYQSVATIAYTGTEAVTEWGLFLSSTYSQTTGSPATASSATSLTGTGTPFTASSASVQGLQQFIVLDTTASPNVFGLITGNTTSVLTVPAWYKATDGTAGSTPGSTDAFTIYPVMWDRKQFSSINVVSGDSIQFQYQLTCTSGG